ncbi:MAG: hypothetical protein LC777_17260, partial [Actinobacteria bacterium]|nr:hypothetical protein [Actinomycetota bacterium]
MTLTLSAMTLLVAPPLSSGLDLGNGRSSSDQGASGTSVVPRAATPPGYQPPLHGTNPHGQGTVSTIDLVPNDQRPLSGDPTGAGDVNREDVVLGRTRGEQRADGTYHGHITILALLGNEVLGVDTNPGQSRAGPLDAVQTGILNNLCMSSGGQLCVTVLKADSTTTATSSTNIFAVANARIGQGPAALSVDAAESAGTISQDSACQTAAGSSRVANANLGLVTASLLTSSTTSKACNNAAPTQTNISSVIGLNGAQLGVPNPGCANGTPNTEGGIPLLLPTSCNADDPGTNQAPTPYGVREALTAFVLT